MSTLKNEDTGKLILRLALGVMLILHGIHKVLHPESLGFISGMLANYGLPSFVGWGVYIGEVVAPIMIILGFHTRTGALLAVINMLFAFVLVHTSELFSLTKMGGWSLELQGFFLFTALALVFLGSGRHAIKPD